MLHPTTPSKADNDIESLKTSLSAKWGIKFQPRDLVWSPSRRDLSRLEDRIHERIRFLYFQKDGSLDHAIHQFERHAATVYSHWQFKPRGELDVVPTLEASESGLKSDFLHKRAPLGDNAVKDLTESLWSNVSQVAERVKKGEKFPKPLVEKPKAASITPSAKTSTSRRQSSITQWFRSKSEPNATTTSQQPSSDDFPDQEVTDLLDEVARSPIPTACVLPDPRSRTSAPASPEDKFETPPSTPPNARSVDLDTDTPGSEFPSFYHKDPEGIPISTRKRSFPESMKPPMPRKMSKETRNHGASNSIGHLQQNNKPAQQVYRGAVPYFLPENAASFTSSSSTGRSSENLASMSTSFTSISTPWTSPNTSFHSESMATSFSSDTGGADPTIRASFSMSRNTLNGKLALQSEANENAWDGFDRAQGLTMTDPGCDPMDIDLETNIASRTLVKPSLQSKESLGGVGVEAADSDFKSQLSERLHLYTPFSIQLPDQHSNVPFHVLYEITRVSIHCKLDINHFSTCLNSTYNTYDELWSSLSKLVEPHGKYMPERSSRIAWDRVGKDFQGVALTGKLSILDQRKGPMYELSLLPLKAEPSYRLSRQFGSDRFSIFGMAGLDGDGLPTYLKSRPGPAGEAIRDWLKSEHHFLGRTWRAFYAKPDVSKRRQKAPKSKDDKIRFRVYFFAENGFGFRQGPRRGEPDPRLLDRPSMSVEDLIEWFMPAKMNKDQSCLKFFARLSLAVSSTRPTIVFKPDEIFRADDALAEAPCPRRLDRKRSDEKKTGIKPAKSKQHEIVMNDGCARISRNAARGIADSLGLDSVPCVFQGRIGGAKGMWMIDTLDENPPALNDRNYWIEITDSQLKFEGHSIDARYPEAARVTFEVNDYPKKLTSSQLSFQLLPILENRGLPAKVFINLLEKDLTARVAEMEIAMDSGLALRKWNQTNNPVTEERAQFGGIEMQGGLPQSTAEKINWFVEHGFEPKTCRFLKDQLRKAICAYCLRLETKMNIGLAESTYAFMIADPLAILEENEVHIAFSSAFRDHKTGVDQTMLHDIDVLVARSPAHLPSDIQKVRAVFKPELRLYRDVIVFPSKGSVSLASKLSGGDYDGDKAWVCWDPDIVGPFRNAQVPDLPQAESYGIEKDTTKVSDLLPHHDYMDQFLGHGFDFNLRISMLGTCTFYHERLCYHKNAIDSEAAMQIAGLLGLLVDSAKGGYMFDKTKWTDFLRRQNLPRNLTEPAYKDRNARPKKHLIDHLVRITAKNVKDDVLKKFADHFIDVPERDDDLSRLRTEAVEEAKTNKELAKVLDNLKTGLKPIKDFWAVHAHVEDDEAVHPTRKSNALTFRTVVERCRGDYLNLGPTLDTLPTSDKIAAWQRDHAARRPSDWDLLKASVAFYHHSKGTFIWHVAGIELGEIKAMAKGRGTYNVVSQEVYEVMKLDSKAVDRALRREILDCDGSGKIDGELDDSDNDFGDPGIDDIFGGVDVDTDEL